MRKAVFAIRPQDLTLRCAVKAPPTAYSTRGQLTGLDSIVASNVPCAIEALRGTEFEIARSMFASATHRVTLRRDSALTLTTKHKLIFKDRTLNIGYIENRDERDYELRLLCSEEV